MPRIAIGRISAARTRLIFPGEPVVTRTNHGSARYVIRVPRTEMVSAATSADDCGLLHCRRRRFDHGGIIIKRLYGFVKYDPRDAKDLRGTQGRAPRADPRRRPSLLRRARLRGRDRCKAGARDRPLARRDLQLLPLQGGPVLELAVRDTAGCRSVWLDRGLEASYTRSWISIRRGSRSTSSSFGGRGPIRRFRTRLEDAADRVRAGEPRTHRRGAARGGVSRRPRTRKSLGIFVNLVLTASWCNVPPARIRRRSGWSSALLEDAIGGARRRTPSRTPA